MENTFFKEKISRENKLSEFKKENSNITQWKTIYIFPDVLKIKYLKSGTVVKNLPANSGHSGDASLIPASGRFPGLGNGNLLQYSCLKNSMDRGAMWATVHGFAKSQTWLHTHTHAPP